MNPPDWSYPAGAENDPNAPYNQPDYDLCPHCGSEDIPDEDEPNICPDCGRDVTEPSDES